MEIIIDGISPLKYVWEMQSKTYNFQRRKSQASAEVSYFQKTHVIGENFNMMISMTNILGTTSENNTYNDNLFDKYSHMVSNDTHILWEWIKPEYCIRNFSSNNRIFHIKKMYAY